MLSRVESRRAVGAAGIVRRPQAQRARLVERAGDQGRDGVVDLAGDAPPLVLLQAHGAPVQVAQLPGLGGAGLPRLLQIAHLLAEVGWPSRPRPR